MIKQVNIPNMFIREFDEKKKKREKLKSELKCWRDSKKNVQNEAQKHPNNLQEKLIPQLKLPFIVKKSQLNPHQKILEDFQPEKSEEPKINKKMPKRKNFRLNRTFELNDYIQAKILGESFERKNSPSKGIKRLDISLENKRKSFWRAYIDPQ